MQFLSANPWSLKNFSVVTCVVVAWKRLLSWSYEVAKLNGLKQPPRPQESYWTTFLNCWCNPELFEQCTELDLEALLDANLNIFKITESYFTYSGEKYLILHLNFSLICTMQWCVIINLFCLPKKLAIWKEHSVKMYKVSVNYRIQSIVETYDAHFNLFLGTYLWKYINSMNR